jgi:polyhydroxyalkanoate synthesis regulator phasin
MADKKKDMPVDMSELIESAFMMGIGVLEMTRDKIAEVSDDLIERGKMSKSEAKKVADRITEVAASQQEVLRKTVSQETERAMGTAGVATHDEIAKLRAELAELKAMLASQGGKAAPKAAAKPRKTAAKKTA